MFDTLCSDLDSRKDDWQPIQMSSLVHQLLTDVKRKFQSGVGADEVWTVEYLMFPYAVVLISFSVTLNIFGQRYSALDYWKITCNYCTSAVQYYKK
jgi:hypothetical protein